MKIISLGWFEPLPPTPPQPSLKKSTFAKWEMELNQIIEYIANKTGIWHVRFQIMLWHIVLLTLEVGFVSVHLESVHYSIRALLFLKLYYSPVTK